MAANYDIIALDRFVQATRDSGYRSTTSAIAELVDNAIQANARRIVVDILKTDDLDHPIGVQVLDDGCGMSGVTLRQALRFGGSSRFDDRRGFGRYGMGLPNASLSQSKRVEVWSATKGCPTEFTYLDVGEIVNGDMTQVPKPVRRVAPHGRPIGRTSPGTLVAWTQCDRLDNRRISTLERRVSTLLGRMYRHFLWDGIEILVNGENLKAVDPLFLHSEAIHTGASIFQKPLQFEVRVPDSDRTSTISVTFSELPVDAWHQLDNTTKREMGVANGAGVSITRGRREVDFGWFLMGSKRRENYDDWWRCEIAFDPELDELFGITHTKQQVRPCEELREILEPSLERVAKILNGRVRDAHTRLKIAAASAPVEDHASKKFAELKPISAKSKRLADDLLGQQVARSHKLVEPQASGQPAKPVYRVVDQHVDSKSFFTPAIANGHVLAVVNRSHPFFKRLYRRLQDRESLTVEQMRDVIQVILLAAARAELMLTAAPDRKALERFRESWGESLSAAFPPGQMS